MVPCLCRFWLKFNGRGCGLLFWLIDGSRGAVVDLSTKPISSDTTFDTEYKCGIALINEFVNGLLIRFVWFWVVFM